MSVLKRIHTTLFFVAILSGCGSLPNEVEHMNEPVLVPLTSSLSELNDAYQPKQSTSETSAVLLQDKGWDALAQRLALIETAEHSIDIQYYIWNSDASGHYLASRLLAAADRGVKVRVMLDDINLNEREDLLVALNAHPQVDIRVFNPIPTRRGVTKWVNFLGDFSRLNRRMHNKSFTVDGVFSVVGGRNIGDEYFDLSNEINFRDRDVLVRGSVVHDIQISFAEYWDSTWSYPVDLLAKEVSSEPASQQPVLDEIDAPVYKNYPALPEDNKTAHQYLTDLMDKMTWVNAKFVFDRPVPVDKDNTDEPKATAKALAKLASESDKDILLESAYLIFDDNQLEGWQELVSKGVEIKALTNSMASNDLTTNHSGYAGRRKDMLEHGIQLYELKPEAGLCEESTRDISKCAPILPYGLHAKSAVFDDKIASIGSFNFNLRSTYLNTESILIIENQEIAQQLTQDIEHAMDEENSWHLKLQEGDVRWYSGDKSWEDEPETGRWERFESQFLQLLPIEKYL
ncbi:phospholipase D family protein [Aliivibrio finisterrensis]|uniref:phospholipase D family protein n=1 Tax=Aliivibrio finisterrensis TaxID=511998 RepID=UPI001022A024|nr:phospholipase D family protein [Aliivibrio finisterrensis]RYU71162.1 phospholipase D family protein [Aliivibrio finisterrensis]RYU74891.1 phospholipase D family protein [Aliivibrio finisterrensis]RYU77336.1 phospholipase D family protein [Aliivibrio finisterrensis]